MKQSVPFSVVVMAMLCALLFTTTFAMHYNNEPSGTILKDVNDFLYEGNELNLHATYQLQITPDRITDPDAQHTLTWTGTPEPTDTIQIYLVQGKTAPSLPYPDGADKKPFLYFRPASLKNTNSIELPIFLTRDMSLYAEYLRTTTNEVTLKGKTEILAYSELCFDTGTYRAEHVRLARTHEAGVLTVQYVTSDPSTVAQFVQLSETEDFSKQYLYLANDTNLTYDITDMFEAPATTPKNFYNPGRFRLATISGRGYSQRYFYRIVDGNFKPLSKTFTLVTPQKPGEDADIFIFGDLGVGFSSGLLKTNQQTQWQAELTKKALISHLADVYAKNPLKNFDLLLIGDISYARGYQWLWDYFFKSVQPISSAIPFHISHGNHEICYSKQEWKPDWSNYAKDSGGEGGVPAYRYFTMPEDFVATPYGAADRYVDDQVTKYKKNTQRNIAYSYDVGAVHIVVFSAEHDFTEGSAQYNFIQKDLSQVNRRVTPWVIVTSHRPMYCTSTGCSISATAPQLIPSMDFYIRKYIQPLLVQYKVNVYVAGHNHHFEFSLPMKEDYVPADAQPGISYIDENGTYISKSIAPVHVLTGASGNDYEPPYQDIQEYFEGNIALHHNQPDWCLFRTFTFGYSHFSANQTHLTHSFYGNKRRTLHARFILTDPY